MSMFLSVFGLLSLLSLSHSYRYDPQYLQYNLNTNQTATDPLDFWGQWNKSSFHPSPENWRFPFYTLFLDRFVNGDPSNDNFNGTSFEHDSNSNQMRHGGDLDGLVDTLDYLHGMGIKGLYIAGSPFINQPWGYDQYSPLDLSVLDPHFGTIETWRNAINEIHARGMYVVLDNTFATMGDLIGFQGYLNETTPFTIEEHKVQWKTDRQYYDFNIGNSYNTTCQYPRFWNETGYRIDQAVADTMKGCYDSDFDQYGDTEAFGVFPDWRRQLSKFASVQDRLRDWHPPVRRKIENYYCMLLASLDIDGFRLDKATQATPDALAQAHAEIRKCARRFGKDNFFIPGEITGGNVFGSIFIGRGRQPDMLPETLDEAVALTNDSDPKYFVREPENAGLDAGAFHYTVYRTLTRFLGLDGNLEAGYDSPRNWVDMWNNFLITNDMVNPMTNRFDPRHMYGVTNQDVFRYGAIRQGKARQLLGHFITSLTLPGVPLLLWGEEQGYYVLDNTASNYIFGRQPMSSALAWQTHGCYSLSSTQYFQMPWEAARDGCNDDTVSYDHRDPSHPMRNIIRHMFHLRDAFPVLNDGFFLQQLSNQTEEIVYPGSSGVATETGLWSVMRSGFAGTQQLDGPPVWLIYSNVNESRTFEFDCSNNDTNLNITALISPFDAGTTVRNLFHPYDEHTLADSPRSLGVNGSTEPNGCLSQLALGAYAYGAYVPSENWVSVKPMITSFSPGHDVRIISSVTQNETETVRVELQFSTEMDCTSVTNSISLDSVTETDLVASLDSSSVNCSMMEDPFTPPFVGAISSVWSWSAVLQNVSDGVHAMTVNNATSFGDAVPMNSLDKFIFRIGQQNNPIVFPRSANYSTTLLSRDSNDKLFVNHSAPGADSWRYSTNWGTTFSDWRPYNGGVEEIKKQPWSGTKLQEWDGEHVRVEYFSRHAGSSDHIQHGDFGKGIKQRRFPHMHLNGPYNQYGYDAGLNSKMSLVSNSEWSHHWMVEWSPNGTLAQINVWGINPDGKPDQTWVMGDADGDSILDRLPPSSLSSVVLNVTMPPPKPHLGWRIVVDDGTLRFSVIPSGSMWVQIIVFVLLWVVPLVTAVFSCWLYLMSFYKVKVNEIGISAATGLIPLALKRPFQRLATDEDEVNEKPGLLSKFRKSSKFQQEKSFVIDPLQKRRTVLIATMEYDIEDWGKKVKIGGLGVMAQLMGKNLGHQDLIWVVPCVAGEEYPVDTPADPMTVTILGTKYEVQVQYHTLRNITYVLLDAPVFRKQTKAEPYPARMDDMDSAIYYSAWNQCIAEAIKRFPIDLYHINDYHGTVAPLYLLPETIPAALSLHNAEFQGLWPMRTKKERDEVCSVFNLPQHIVAQYVQFGEVFNLLHAGASILRVHQEGFGAVGVSKKYGKRSYARYPILWGLKSCGALPNPDPSDTGPWDKKLPKESDIKIDQEFEAGRGDLRKQAQEWAGLEVNPKAELFVFVGRWSNQKGVDLIADVFPAIIEANPNVQLICIGPVIDLYGKFAAMKLDRMMKMYPGRVCSKPVFTALPPFVFSGAEFALIPSRDEPFGLVAVEFGRKGALGVGARVGGLGQMPGFWFTVESTTTLAMLSQFRQAIDEALSCKYETRAMMRARSNLQRFPVAQWVEDLEILQSTAIRLHEKVKSQKGMVGFLSVPASTAGSGTTTPRNAHSRSSSYVGLAKLGARLKQNAKHSREASAASSAQPATGLTRSSSLGSRRGPGHVVAEDHHDGLVERSILAPIPDMDGDRTEVALGPNHQPDDNRNYDSDAESFCEAEDDGQCMSMRLRHQPRIDLTHPRDGPLSPQLSPRPRFGMQQDHLPSPPDTPGTPDFSEGLLRPPRPVLADDSRRNTSLSMLSVESVVGEKHDFYLQKVDPFFTDSQGEYQHAFMKKLEGLNASNSTTTTSIEDFLIKSEKKWFTQYRDAKLGRYHPASSRSSLTLYNDSRPVSRAPSMRDGRDSGEDPDDPADQFLLPDDYKPPTGVRKWLQLRIGDWPVYAFLLGLGQIISANSYQITLLTGEVGQTASKLYVIASIYLATSIMWWMFYRRFASRITLSLPWFFYGLAFILIGTAHFAAESRRGWIQNVGTAFYAVASSSGSIFFALNFGDEGGAQVKAWVFRACVIQGTQQIYIAALWYWGSVITARFQDGVQVAADPVSSTWRITAITLPIAILLWSIGLVLYFGLPNYYRQSPGKMPSFYRSLTRRKIVLWFFITVIIQNFFLSAPYGRNWTFLWSSRHTATWQIVLLILAFFVGVWAIFLWIFGYLSKSHSWILPLFAIGLGAPRWAQIWWGTSNIGLWLPWAGGFTSSALVSRALWLWLGTLDAIQGVGLGMILLGTLTRVHVAFTLITAQVLGSIATIVARAVAPNKIGPGPISPDVSGGVGSLWQAWFWIGLVANLLVCVGFYKFYRKEQLTKP